MEQFSSVQRFVNVARNKLNSVKFCTKRSNESDGLEAYIFLNPASMKSLLALVLGMSSLELAVNETVFTVVKWNKHLREFVSIVEGTAERIARQDKAVPKGQIATNMNGQPVRMIYYEVKVSVCSIDRVTLDFSVKTNTNSNFVQKIIKLFLPGRGFR